MRRRAPHTSATPRPAGRPSAVALSNQRDASPRAAGMLGRAALARAGSAYRALEPHGLVSYLQELAGGLHNYYNKFRVIGEDRNLGLARSVLVKAVRTTLQNGLRLLGISAPEKM